LVLIYYCLARKLGFENRLITLGIWFLHTVKRGLLIMDSNIYDLTVIYLYATI